jgi:hypothetical protein
VLERRHSNSNRKFKVGNTGFFLRTYFVYLRGLYAIRAFKKELAGYKTAKGSIQFSLDKPLPTSLIKKIAKFRSKELRAKDVKWM